MKMVKKEKTTKIECMELRTKVDGDISMQVDSTPKYPYEKYNSISTTFNSSGTLIVHSCQSIFTRSELIESIEEKEMSGTKYTIIHYKRV
jgi:hypothetical protein